MSTLYHILWMAIIITTCVMAANCYYQTRICNYLKDHSTNDELIKDPKVFHFSIIYLMVYMAQSGGNTPHLGRLRFIFQYIMEAVPPTYRKEATDYLNLLNSKGIQNGEGIINTLASLNKGQLFLKNKFSFEEEYHLEINGLEMAEALAMLNEKQRLYIYYLLFRVAIADEKTAKCGKTEESELKVLGKRLNVPEIDQYSLKAAGLDSSIEYWYNAHFDSHYKAFDEMTDLYPMTMEEMGHSYLRPEKQFNAIGKSLLKYLRRAHLFTCIITFVSCIAFFVDIDKTHCFTDSYLMFLFFLTNSVVMLQATYAFQPICFDKLNIKSTNIFHDHKKGVITIFIIYYLAAANWAYTIINQGYSQVFDKKCAITECNSEHMSFETINTENDKPEADVNILEKVAFNGLKYFCFYRWCFNDNTISEYNSPYCVRFKDRPSVTISYNKGYFSCTSIVNVE